MRLSKEARELEHAVFLREVCSKKRAFPLKVQAETKALSLMNHPLHYRRSQGPLYVYKCPCGPHYHLTSKPQ